MNLTAWFCAIREIGIDLVGRVQPDSFGPNVFGLLNHPPEGEDIADPQRKLVQ
jgi:hypothetical protein